MEKKLLCVLNGDPIWPPPVWLMRQAGRYLPEYRQIRKRYSDFLTLCRTPSAAAEITLQPVLRFGFDAAILFSDILIVPWALGQTVQFVEGRGPILEPIRMADQLSDLESSRHFQERVSPVMETVVRVRESLDRGVTLLGFAGAPFTVACYMIEGRSEKDFPVTRHILYNNESLFSSLITLLTERTVDYLSWQIDAGSDAVMLFDTWAGQLPPLLFERYVTGPHQKIATALRSRYPSVRIIGFPRQAGTMYASYALRTAIDGLGIDTAVDLATISGWLPRAVALQGNLDPVALAVGGDGLIRQVRAILDAMRGHRFIFNLGHGVLPETPPENVSMLVKLVRAG